MQVWMLLWKVFLIVSMVLFGLMAIWVTIWGAIDIKKMLRSIKTEHETGATEHAMAREGGLQLGGLPGPVQHVLTGDMYKCI